MQHPTIGTPVFILCRTENLGASGIAFLHRERKEIAREYVKKGCKIPKLHFYSLIEFFETLEQFQNAEHILVLLDPTNTTRSGCKCQRNQLLCLCGMNDYNIYPSTQFLEDVEKNPLSKIDKRDVIIPSAPRIIHREYTCFDIETYS